jgi:hypothetical protein
LLNDEEFLAIGVTLMTPEAQRRMAVYAEWVQRRAQRFPSQDRLVNELFERVANEVPDVQTDWAKHALQREGIKDERRWLALWRVLAPLADATWAGGIERTHDELSTEEFQRFVRLGWEREKLLLRRDADVVRAGGVSARA